MGPPARAGAQELRLYDVENQGYTLTEIRRLLTDDEFRARLVANLTLPQAREFWELEYNTLPRREQLQRVASTLNKVDEFLTPAIYPIVGFGRTTVDFREAMDKGKVVLVKLPVGQLGSAPAALLGSIIVAQIFNAALSRQDLAPEARRQFNLFADEYHRFATPTFADLLAEARKYGLATTLAHQFRDQLDGTNRGATLTAGNLIVFSVGGEDAEELAKQFDRTPPPPEVVGQRPKLTVSQRPVEHLVRDGHESAVVRLLVDRWLQAIVRGAEQLDSDSMFGSPWHPYREDRDTLVGGIDEINAYLVGLMERRTPLGSSAEASALVRVLTALRSHFRFAPAFRPLSRSVTEPLPEETSRALRTCVDELIAGEPVPEWKSPSERAMDDLRAARLRYWSGIDEPSDLHRERARDEAEIVLVAWDLHRLGAALTASPVLVGSGQWEPIYDRPRTYSDVEAETASDLVNLPKFQARCKLFAVNQVVERRLRIAERTAHQGLRTPSGALAIRERARRDQCDPLPVVLDRIGRRVQAAALSAEAHTQRRVRLVLEP